MAAMYWLPIVGVVLIVVFEILAALTHNKQTGRLMTLSQMYWAVAGRSLKSALVFAGGFLAGHLVTWHG